MAKIKHLLETFNETKQRIGLTKFDRIEKYITNVEKHKLKGKRDIETAKEIRELIDYRLKKVKRLYYLNLFMFIGIYFSVFSIFLPSFFTQSELGIFIGKLIGVFGTTVFIIGIFISNRVQELYYQDLNLLTSHFISIYSRNESKKDIIAGTANAYHEFVQFFKHKKEEK